MTEKYRRHRTPHRAVCGVRCAVRYWSKPHSEKKKVESDVTWWGRFFLSGILSLVSMNPQEIFCSICSAFSQSKPFYLYKMGQQIIKNCKFVTWVVLRMLKKAHAASLQFLIICAPSQRQENPKSWLKNSKSCVENLKNPLR